MELSDLADFLQANGIDPGATMMKVHEIEHRFDVAPLPEFMFCHRCDALIIGPAMPKKLCTKCALEGKKQEDEQVVPAVAGDAGDGGRTQWEMNNLPSSRHLVCRRCSKNFLGPYSLADEDAFCDDCAWHEADWRRTHESEDKEPSSKAARRGCLFTRDCGCEVYDLEDRKVVPCKEHAARAIMKT